MLCLSISQLTVFFSFIRHLNCRAQYGAVQSPVVNPDTEATSLRDVSSETGRHIEGDMVVPKWNLLGRNALTNTNKLWSEGKVCYWLPSVDPVLQNALRIAIDDFEKFSCIRFHAKTPMDRDCIRIMREDGCWSHVGRVGGIQDLSLGHGCELKATVIHELMHALGFAHEQNREDRDEFVTIHWENVDWGVEHAFKKAETDFSTYELPYDFNSVMHYGPYYFSRNGQATISAKNTSVPSVGQRSGFTEMDLKKLNKVYCSADNEKLSVGKVNEKPTILQYANNLTAFINVLRGAMNASSMMKMKWSQALAVESAIIAEQCLDQTYSEANGKAYLRFSTSSTYNDLKKVFSPVLNEYSNALLGLATRTDRMCCDATGACQNPCHEKFRIIINSATNSFGCALARCNGLKESTQASHVLYYHAVCAFAPGLTGSSSKPFNSGSPCSECVGSVCEENLCVGGRICSDDPDHHCEKLAQLTYTGKSLKDVCDWYMPRGWQCNRTCGHCGNMLKTPILEKYQKTCADSGKIDCPATIERNKATFSAVYLCQWLQAKGYGCDATCGTCNTPTSLLAKTV